MKYVRGKLTLDSPRLSSFAPLDCHHCTDRSLLQFARPSAPRPAQPPIRERISRACERLTVSHVNRRDTSLLASCSAAWKRLRQCKLGTHWPPDCCSGRSSSPGNILETPGGLYRLGTAHVSALDSDAYCVPSMHSCRSTQPCPDGQVTTVRAICVCQSVENFGSSFVTFDVAQTARVCSRLSGPGLSFPSTRHGGCATPASR
jgi:hypothetical protein